MFALFSIGLYWRRNLPFPLLNSHDTASELVLNSLFCQDAVFAHCSFLLWFYTNGWARLCMARPWPPRGSGTGSCTLPPYGLWNHAAVPGGVRSSLIRLLLFALWNVVEGWRAAALSPFWEGVVFEQSRYCSIPIGIIPFQQFTFVCDDVFWISSAIRRLSAFWYIMKDIAPLDCLTIVSRNSGSPNMRHPSKPLSSF